MQPQVGPSSLINRELSWLDFNRRVLTLADDENLPLLERAKFLAIHSSNMDEFFRVRVAGLHTKIANTPTRLSDDGLTPSEQLALVRGETKAHYKEIGRIYSSSLMPSLASAGIHILDIDDLTRSEKKLLNEQFISKILPVLTPLSVDPTHPFPYISDLAFSLGLWLQRSDGERTFARVKIPSNLPRFIEVSTTGRYVALENLVADSFHVLFPGLTVLEFNAFRLTRDADLDFNEEDADDLLALVEFELQQRRFGEPVRLEVSASMSLEMLAFLTSQLGIESDDVFKLDSPLDLNGLLSLYEIDRPDLKYPPHRARQRIFNGERRKGPSLKKRFGTRPKTPSTRFTESRVFKTLKQADVLVQHPYDSFNESVGKLIAEAAKDKQVLAIKITLYRAAEESKLVDALISATKRGIQVVVVVELKARFDEQANIEWARLMEKEGIHVVYGVLGLKTHNKNALIVRQEDNEIRQYVHIGTGNYNSDTASIFEDLGLFTSDPNITSEVASLFNSLTAFSEQQEFQNLIVAPNGVRPSLLELIQTQSTSEGRIVIKVNSLQDPEIITELYRASQQGCEIDLIVRGICCLLPGVEGLSDNITVRSYVGRFLEHSRVYRFGRKRGDTVWLIGSADVMARNLDARVETLVPVKSPKLRKQIESVINEYLSDTSAAWFLEPNGGWTYRHGFDIHQKLMNKA